MNSVSVLGTPSQITQPPPLSSSITKGRCLSCLLGLLMINIYPVGRIIFNNIELFSSRINSWEWRVCKKDPTFFFFPPEKDLRDLHPLCGLVLLEGNVKQDGLILSGE